jgi:hypothetical protein
MPEPDWRSFDKLRMTAWFIGAGHGTRDCVRACTGSRLAWLRKTTMLPTQNSETPAFCARCRAGECANERSAPPLPPVDPMPRVPLAPAKTKRGEKKPEGFQKKRCHPELVEGPPISCCFTRPAADLAWNVPTATRQMPEPDWRSFDKLRMTGCFFGAGHGTRDCARACTWSRLAWLRKATMLWIL